MNISQQILGTDKRNPLFTVYCDEFEELHVYYGFELLEVVSADRENPNFKMLLGRLYNAGLNRKVLTETFTVDLKTIRRWGRALRCRDAEQLVGLLAGRRAGRKLTPEIQAYVRLRWPELSCCGTYGISGRLRREIQSVFKISLSCETLRPLVGELKKGEGHEAGAVGQESSSTTADDLPEHPPSCVENQEVSSKEGETTCDCSIQSPSELAQAQRLEQGPQTLWCDHAGLLVFAPRLLAVAQAMDPPQPLFKQWLASLLLGALNIEQTKFLNWEDMSRLLGSVVRFPHPQRQELERVATEASFGALARFNAQLIGADDQSDFYFDPHTKHYTGQENVLKGWCSAIRWADKAIHSDFIHSAKGEPLYFETTDNFADLRQRFFEVTQRCRDTMQWPKQRVLSWVVDRGIFANEVFEKVLQDPAMHLITWQKGYKAQSWPPASGLSGSMVIERVRNRAQDIRCYHLEYWDRPWPKEIRLRQIVVQATNPKGRTVQVAILSDDKERAAQEIIALMLSRWLQENDFKYLDKHFGINQITSYGIIEYEDLRQKVADRQVRSAQTKALQQQGRGLRSQQGRLLLAQAKAAHQATQRQERIQQLESTSCSDQENKELRRRRQEQTRYKNTEKARQEQIQSLSRQLAQLNEKTQTVQKTESRLERLIAEKMVRMDPGKKRLMDNLRVIARNVFYLALAPFKKAYNNYRDDHDQFREVTQSAGVLEVKSDSIMVHIMPRVSFSPQVRRILAGVLEELNQNQPMLPDGTSRRLSLRLASRSELTVKLVRSD
tara:strand:+ start:220 stop:2562 length:2343 start_codon:yes stop_codon:yes gene_type:complete